MCFARLFALPLLSYQDRSLFDHLALTRAHAPLHGAHRYNCRIHVVKVVKRKEHLIAVYGPQDAKLDFTFELGSCGHYNLVLHELPVSLNPQVQTVPLSLPAKTRGTHPGLRICGVTCYSRSNC